MKIAVIGVSGLLGCAIVECLGRTNNKLLLLTHDDIDISETSSYKVVEYFNPDVLINTAAFLGVEPCEAQPEKAFLINTLAVGYLARFCHERGIVLVHISTDAVFDGITGDYDENAVPNPVNMYGLTKLGGEYMVRNLCTKHYVFRIPILFGHRKNKGFIFIEKMMDLYKNGKKNIVIADDVMNKPSFSFDVANEIINTIISQNKFGTYHVFNGGNQASLYDFAAEYFINMGVFDVQLTRGKASYFSGNERGRKPLNTTLSSIKTKPLRDWREAMKDYCEK